MQVLTQVRYDNEVVNWAHLKCFDYTVAVTPSVGSWPGGQWVAGSRPARSMGCGLVKWVVKYLISNISNQLLKVYTVYEESKYIYILLESKQPQNFMLNQSPSIHPIFHEVESKRLEPWLVEIVISIKESVAGCHLTPSMLQQTQEEVYSKRITAWKSLFSSSNICQI